MDPVQTRSQSAPTDSLVKDKTEALAETTEEVISKKISKYDVLKVRVWLEECPAAVVEEAFRVVDYRFHDLLPVEALQTLCILDIARTRQQKNN